YLVLGLSWLTKDDLQRDIWKSDDARLPRHFSSLVLLRRDDHTTSINIDPGPTEPQHLAAPCACQGNDTNGVGRRRTHLLLTFERREVPEHSSICVLATNARISNTRRRDLAPGRRVIHQIILFNGPGVRCPYHQDRLVCRSFASSA